MPNIITPKIPRKEGFEPCPDPWAKLHAFYNPATGQIIPARCKRWTCYECAQVNYYRVDRLLALGDPERFITLTRAGTSPKEINFNLKHLIQGLRRKGYVFEYAAVVELHLNGQPHLHMMQRGDFIPQELLSQMWETYTAKSYGGSGSFIVDIRKIDPNQNVKGYLMKYLKKSWQQENTNSKSWARLQELYPGLNHYRMSRNWLANPLAPVKSAEKWEIVPVALLETVGTPLDPVDELFYTDTVDPLTGVQALRMQSRKTRPKLHSDTSLVPSKR